MSQDDGQGSFFSRWSKRKAQVQQGGATVPTTASPAAADTAGPMPVTPATEPPPQAAVVGAGPAAVTAEASGRGGPGAVAADSTAVARPTVEPVPRPTLQDVEQLDAQSDYRHFVARDVDPEVRNAAFKKLFHSDPHFNVMDGLDVYIDDYNTPNPLPVAIMKTLVQARALGLIDDELKEQDAPSPAPVGVQKGVASAADAEHTTSVENAQRAQNPLPTTAQSPSSAGAWPEAEPMMVECVLVPDRASNDEPISEQTAEPINEQVPAAATAEGSVVPFPRRPGNADPA